MITETNHCFGSEKPSQYMVCDDGVRINSDIRSKDIEVGEYTMTAWFATSTLVPKEDNSYPLYKRMIELQKLCDEHDELIAELIEGGEKA